MQTYTGEIIHSSYFQTPLYYVGKTVVIVGGGLSGIDILTEIHTVAKKVEFINICKPRVVHSSNRSHVSSHDCNIYTR